MKKQRIGVVIVAIEQLLGSKRISPSKRKRLRKRRRRLQAKMEDDLIGFVSVKGIGKFELA